MTSSELAEFVGKVRRLFRGEIDEEIFALAKVRIGGLRLPVCLAALDDYALLYGGSKGRFIPAKFFEFYAKRTTEETSQTTKVAKAVSRHLAEDVERGTIAEDWRRIRSICETLDAATRSEIVRFLEGSGWSRFSSSVSEWSQVQILAVSDIAADRFVERGFDPETGKSAKTEDPRSFWSRVGGGRIRSGDGLRVRPSLDPPSVSGGSGEAGNRLSRVPAVEIPSPVEETEIPF